MGASTSLNDHNRENGPTAVVPLESLTAKTPVTPAAALHAISMGPKNPNAIPQPTGVTLISVPTNVGPSMGPQAVRHEATTHI